MNEQKLTGYPSIDKPWLKYYSEEAVNAPLPECTIYEYLWENNKGHDEDIALNYYGHKFTYAQLFTQIEQTVKAFSALGVRAGDIVVICTVNTPEAVFALYALNRLGAISNMVDPRTNTDGLREYIRESDAKVILTVDLAYPAIKKAMEGTAATQVIVISPADSLPPAARFLYRLKTKSPKLGAEALTWGSFLTAGKHAHPTYAPYAKDTCYVMAHTGGTTGFPKTVMLSNDNINAMAHSYRYLDIPFRRQQRYFNDLPPFIMYGLCLATHTALCFGLEVILYPVFDSKGFPKQFIKYRPHHFCALVDHVKYLATAKEAQHLDLSDFITAGVGGDSVDCQLERQVNDYLRSHSCKYDMTKGYGMTELAATAISTTPQANAIGSVGIPLVINTVKIIDPDTLRELSYDQVGEIWISGPSIMLGYYNRPQETAEILVKDDAGVQWIRTGDLGYMNQDGLLFHRGRIRRIYMTAYEGQPAKIFPTLVEDALNRSDAVRGCNVVGRKRQGSDYYEAVAFVVKADPQADEVQLRQKLLALCQEAVPTYMIPAEFRFVDSVPLTPIGKVDFRTLEQMAAENAK